MNIPDNDYVQGVYSWTRPGATAGNDGVMATMSRDNLGGLSGLVAYLRLQMVFANGTIVDQRAEIFGGVVHRRDGTIETQSVIQATWPRELQNGQRQPLRPDTLKMELEVIQPLRCALMIDAIQVAANTANQVQR